MKLIDYSVLYASKLNESSQWITKSDEIVDISSERFSVLIMENVKDKNVGKVKTLTIILNIFLFIFLVHKFNMSNFDTKCSKILPRH